MPNNLFKQRALDLYERYGFKFATFAAFFLSLKLSIAYAFLIPLIATWIVARGRDTIKSLTRSEQAFFLFVLVAALSSIFGLDPARSSRRLLSLFYFGISMPVYRELITKERRLTPIIALVVGQTVSSLFTVFQSAFPESLGRVFLGAVSQSGQLGMIFPLAIGLYIFLQQKNSAKEWSSLETIPRSSMLEIVLGAALLIILLLIGFAPTLPISELGILALAAGGAITLAIAFRFALDRQSLNSKARSILAGAAIPVLLVALLVNLKRGPWLGVFVALCILFAKFQRRLIVPILVGAILVVATVAPIRTRLLHSSNDFFIEGGRNVMWRIATDLIPRFPLGIGYGNSRILQKFSTEIPPQHTHFHNNVLNILVETGWLGLGAFLFWLFSLGKIALFSNNSDNTVAILRACGVALISWQVAGIVEYNVGDSEVAVVAYIIAGLLGAISVRANAPSASDSLH